MYDHFRSQCLQYQALNLEHHTKLGKSSSSELYSSRLRILVSNLPTNDFLHCFSVELLRGGGRRIKATGLLYAVYLIHL